MFVASSLEYRDLRLSAFRCRFGVPLLLSHGSPIWKNAAQKYAHFSFEATASLNAPTRSATRQPRAHTRPGHVGKSPKAYSETTAMELLDADQEGRHGHEDGAGRRRQMEGSRCLRALHPCCDRERRESLTDTALNVTHSQSKCTASPSRLENVKYDFDQRFEQGGSSLRDEFYVWALENARVLAETYAGADLEAAVNALELNDRATDIWKPLLAVARVLPSGERSNTYISGC